MALAVGQGHQDGVEVEQARSDGLIGLVGQNLVQARPGALGSVRPTAARRVDGQASGTGVCLHGLFGALGIGWVEYLLGVRDRHRDRRNRVGRRLVGKRPQKSWGAAGLRRERETNEARATPRVRCVGTSRHVPVGPS